MENNAVKNGLLFGVIWVIYSLVLYLIDPVLMMQYKFNMAVPFLIALAFMIKVSRDEKADNDGILTYGEAVKTTFLVCVIAISISTLFSFVLYNFIDPTLSEATKEYAMDSAEAFADFLKMPEEQKDEMMEGLDEEEYDMTIVKSIYGFIVFSLFYLVICLIVSAFVKKNPSLE